MTRSASFTLLLSLLLVACPSDPPATDAGSDTGTVTDAGADDSGGGADTPSVTSATCTAPHVVTLAATGPTTVTGDTTGMSNALTRAADCGGTVTAPQEVLEIALPGAATETTGVRFSLVTDGTADAFDTLVEVRTDCDDAATASCHDDAGFGEIRSDGVFTASGGSTVYVIVSGFAPPFEAGVVSSGPWEIEIETATNQHAPVLTAASALEIGTDVRIAVVGTDADADAELVRVTFLDAGGAPVAFDDDLDPETDDVTDFYGLIDLEMPGTTTFDGSASFTITSLPEWASVATADVVVLDGFELESASVEVTPMPGTTVGLGSACSATNVCVSGLRCIASVCAIPPAAVAACDGATTLTASSAGPVTTIVTVPTGPGAIRNADPECSDSPPSGEALVDLTLPAGVWDVTARTAGTTTADTDTIVYLVASCGDPTTQLACADDVDGTGDPPDYSSELTAEGLSGTYTLAVEIYGGVDAPTMIDLAVSLVEVLPTGAACDPTFVMNRCATGTCPITGTAVCP